MTRFTLAWTVWLLAFVVIEWAAYVHGGYRETATGHCVRAMLSNGWLMVAVPLVFVGIAIHVLADALRLVK